MSRSEVVRVYFKDDTYKALAVREAITADEVCAEFAKKMRFPGSPLLFCLSEVNGDAVRAMAAEEAVWPSVVRWRQFGWAGAADDRYHFRFGLSERARLSIAMRLADQAALQAHLEAQAEALGPHTYSPPSAAPAPAPLTQTFTAPAQSYVAVQPASPAYPPPGGAKKTPLAFSPQPYERPSSPPLARPSSPSASARPVSPPLAPPVTSPAVTSPSGRPTPPGPGPGRANSPCLPGRPTSAVCGRTLPQPKVKVSAPAPVKGKAKAAPDPVKSPPPVKLPPPGVKSWVQKRALPKSQKPPLLGPKPDFDFNVETDERDAPLVQPAAPPPKTLKVPPRATPKLSPKKRPKTPRPTNIEPEFDDGAFAGFLGSDTTAAKTSTPAQALVSFDDPVSSFIVSASDMDALLDVDFDGPPLAVPAPSRSKQPPASTTRVEEAVMDDTLSMLNCFSEIDLFDQAANVFADTIASNTELKTANPDLDKVLMFLSKLG